MSNRGCYVTSHVKNWDNDTRQGFFDAVCVKFSIGGVILILKKIGITYLLRSFKILYALF